MSGATSRFLTRLAATLRQEVAAIKRLDGALIECDIAARRREASLGRRWAAMRTRIRDELEKRQISESDWCKQQLACDVATMRRRVQLAKGWQQYERVRREMGDNGQYGLLYALSLIRTAPHDNATNAHPLRIRSTQGPILEGCHQSRCQFITGDALSELRKMRTGSVNVIVCSPPYWPLKRWYGGSGIGFEPSLKAYLRVLVSVFHEARRVLKDNGVMWIVMGDSYSKSGRKWRPPQSELGDDAGYQGTGRPEGNLLLIPARLGMALQDDGWILRQDIIWDKGWVRPETARDRVTRTHEFALMFAKTRHYFYDTDPLRVPLVSRRTATRGRDKAGHVFSPQSRNPP